MDSLQTCHRPVDCRACVEDIGRVRQFLDLELYDISADPNELVNLASQPAQRANILRLNTLINALIDREVGTDNGSEYPGDTAQYNQPF